MRKPSITFIQLKRSFGVMIVVGVALNIINQFDTIIGGQSINWLKVVLTFLVPFFVSLYGAYFAQKDNLH